MTDNDNAPDKDVKRVLCDPNLLCREWVEIREENSGSRIVLKPATSEIPPARGRCGLDLSIAGKAEAQSAGPDDRMVGKPGVWTLTDNGLSLKAPGWDGDYQIEELTAERLVIRIKM
ncbi:MAG: hypothetical protein ACTHWH_11860 [Marinobacter sp.]